MRVLYVGAGGFIGSILRYIISVYAPKLFGTSMPYGTLIVNVVGAVLIGFLTDICLSNNVPYEIRLLLTTGILGGFTTFSTFSYESVAILAKGAYGTGVLNICMNLFLSLGGVVLGEKIAGFFLNLGR